jgi:hypothetical protein
MLVFLFLLCSCSGGIDPGGGSPQEKEGIEKEVENPDEDEDEDETEEDETEDSETKDNETKNIDNISREIPPAPIFLYCKTVSENKIVFGFSQPVTMVSLDFDIELNYEKSGKGKTITVNLAEDLENGKIFTADFLAEDAYGNRVKKQVSFFSTASSAPALQINELRTEYSGSSLKAEFIEFKMLSDGNLGGLRVFVAGNNKNPMLYEFASVEVKAGEYVVLHLRKLEEASKDEYGVKLDESGGTDSSPTARDFWIPGSSKLLHKTDAVYVLDQNGWTLDAVMIAENSDSWLKKDYFVKTAEFLFEHNAWKSATGTVSGVADAVDSSGIKTAITRSISRKELTENTHTAADWYVTATSGVSPGLRNKP